MAKNGHLREKGITSAQNYLKGCMEGSEEELDTGESLWGRL